MNSVTVTLANRSYALRAGISVRRLEKSLIAAVRRGAGIVRLPLAAGPEVHALVSPATPVTIEFSSSPQSASVTDCDEPGSPADGTAWADAITRTDSHVHPAEPIRGEPPREWMADPAIDWLDLERGLLQSQ